jgi:hypothetical protein
MANGRRQRSGDFRGKRIGIHSGVKGVFAVSENLKLEKPYAPARHKKTALENQDGNTEKRSEKRKNRLTG